MAGVSDGDTLTARCGEPGTYEQVKGAYFVQHGRQVVVLLGGGSKRTQTSDIKRVKALAALLDGLEK